jgi:hypothetical protein
MIDVSKLATVQECRILMTKAARLGRIDVRHAALRRCVELQVPSDRDPVGGVLAALEEVFRLCYGRALKANRTRGKAKAVGVVALLTDWALGHGEDSGFDMLIEEGLGDYTGEYVVAVNAPAFVAEAVKRRAASSRRAGARCWPGSDSGFGRHLRHQSERRLAGNGGRLCGEGLEDQ